MFNAYVINLERSKDRWKKIVNRFKHTDLKNNIIRYSAIDGMNINRELLITKTNFWTRAFCPSSTIGCGISHIELAEYLYKNDKNPYALILEDDVYPLSTKLKDIIQHITSNPKFKDWDIIRLYCQGFYPKGYKYDSFTSKLFSGSAAAYLLSKKGQKKMSDKIVKYHIDTQQNFCSDLKLYRENKYKLFSVDIENSGSDQVELDTKELDKEGLMIHLGGVTWEYAMNFPVGKIPFININICVWHIVVIFTLIFFISFIVVIKKCT